MEKVILKIFNVVFNLILWLAVVPMIIIAVVTLGYFIDEVGHFVMGKYFDETWSKIV